MQPENAVGYAMYRSRSHDAVIRVYDDAGNLIKHANTREISRAMKRISALKSGQVTVTTSGTNLTEAVKLAEEARLNRLQVIEGALSIEHQVNAIILHYFFGSSHPRLAYFRVPNSGIGLVLVCRKA